MEEITIGLEVKLKSGGPVMTVGSEKKVDGTVACQWFEKKELKEGHFAPESLVIFKGEETNEIGSM